MTGRLRARAATRAPKATLRGAAGRDVDKRQRDEGGEQKNERGERGLERSNHGGGRNRRVEAAQRFLGASAVGKREGELGRDGDARQADRPRRSRSGKPARGEDPQRTTSSRGPAAADRAGRGRKAFRWGKANQHQTGLRNVWRKVVNHGGSMRDGQFA